MSSHTGTDAKRLRDLPGWAAAESAARAAGVGAWVTQEVGAMAPWPSLRKLTPSLVRDLCVIVMVSAPLGKVFGPDEGASGERPHAKLGETADPRARRRGLPRP